jgi:hypothetical protein
VAIIIRSAHFGLGDAHHLEADFHLWQWGAAKRSQYSGARILEVQGVGAALAAIADDHHLLALDQINVGIPVIINAHVCNPRETRARHSGRGYGSGNAHRVHASSGAQRKTANADTAIDGKPLGTGIHTALKPWCRRSPWCWRVL